LNEQLYLKQILFSDHPRRGKLMLVVASDDTLRVLHDELWVEGLHWTEDQIEEAVANYRALVRELAPDVKRSKTSEGPQG